MATQDAAAHPFTLSSRINARDIYQPPKSPAPAIATPTFAPTTDYSTLNSRKRARPDSSHGAHWGGTPKRADRANPGDGSYNDDIFGQGSALVNERYRLAGGYDTPTLQANAELENMFTNEADLSRQGVRDGGFDPMRSRNNYHAMIAGPLARERNGVARMPAAQNGSPTTWTGMAFDLVGKVFTFGSSVIRGFYAGQGEGFDFRHSPRPDLFARPQQRQEEDGGFGCSTPVPGSWRDDEFLGDFEQDNPSTPQSRPANKRRQMDRDTWVMVGTPDLPKSEAASRRATTTPTGTAPSSFASSTAAATRGQASRASSRRSLAPASRRQTSQHTTQQGGSPGRAPLESSGARRASFAPARSSPQSRRVSIGDHGNRWQTVYVSPEAERFAKRQARQSRVADKTMSSMSRKLEDLIRQGQEALGTKFSVVDGMGGEESDEGFVEDEGW